MASLKKTEKSVMPTPLPVCTIISTNSRRLLKYCPSMSDAASLVSPTPTPSTSDQLYNHISVSVVLVLRYIAGTSVITNNLTVITDNFTIITDNFTIITDNFTVITDNFTVITDNFTVITDNFAIITDNFAIITDNFAIITDNFAIITDNFVIITDNFIDNTTENNIKIAASDNSKTLKSQC
ncbi:hypothetical protein FHG87_018936 [Trinorchestia longiramus]|nr:hypothetical protein FHG87_018936 [Trinorchestia longiramus]